MTKIDQNTTVGWIGTGVMGAAMLARLQAAGYASVVYTRTKEKAQPRLDAGAQWADSPRAVAQQCDVVFTIVGFPNDVREVYFGEEGLLAGAFERSCFSRYDHHRTQFGARNLPTSPNPTSTYHRRPGVGWRRRSEKRHAVDYGRRR